MGLRPWWPTLACCASVCAAQPTSNRRIWIKHTAAAALGVGLASCPQQPALPLAKITSPATNEFDLPRDAARDRGFARGMATGMEDYERAVAQKKGHVFDKLFDSLPKRDAVVIELGIGSFPNAPFYANSHGVKSIDLIGVDPNDSMEKYARRSAEKAALIESGVVESLRIVHGVAESLPLRTGSVDAVVCTLTLCSVVDPSKVLSEVSRILKPGGKFLFLEHVLSETDPLLAKQQILATPLQIQVADGCHLDRRTLEFIKAGEFSSVDGEYLDLQGFAYLNPTVYGLAVK